MINTKLSKNFEWVENIKVDDKQKTKNEILRLLKVVENKLEKSDFDIFNDCRKVLEHSMSLVVPGNTMLSQKIDGLLRKYNPEAEVFSSIKSIQRITNEHSHAYIPTDFSKPRQDTSISVLRDVYISLTWLFANFNFWEKSDKFSPMFDYKAYLDEKQERIISNKDNNKYDSDLHASSIPSDTIGLIDFIMEENNNFYIPHYQRDYTWDDIDINSFFEDVEKRIGDKHTHHMGVFALAKNKEKKLIRVVDGQQRITTTLLILAAYKNLFDEDKIKFSNNIFFDWTKNIENKYTNVSNEKINNIKNILSGIEPRVGKNKIEKAYIAIKSEIRTLKKKNISYQEQFETIKNQFVVSCFQYSNLSTKLELEVFENINSKGQSLEESNLIENLMIHSIREEDIDEENRIRTTIDNNINKIMKQTGNTKTNWNKFYTYINDISLYIDSVGEELSANIKKHKIYNKFKTHWAPDSNFTLKQFEVKINEVSKKLKIWTMLKSKDYNNMKIFANTKHNLNAINQKDVHYTLLYFIINNTSNFDEHGNLTTIKNKNIFEECVRILEIYLVRLMVTEGTGQSMSSTFNNAISYLKKVKISDYPKTLWNYFQNLSSNQMPSTQRFKNAIISNQTKQNWAQKAILISLEKFIINADNKHKNQDIIPKDIIQIEHILPQKPKLKKDKFANYDEVIENIGNKIILDGATNNKLKNKNFKQKQLEYPKHNFFLLNGFENKKHKIIITSLSKYKTFTKKEIQERTEEIANAAINGPYADLKF